jgi:outer membrane protein assembly factor BamB
MRQAVRAAILWSFALLAGACDRSTSNGFVYSTDAASRSGLLETPQGAVVGNEAGRVVLLRSDGSVGWSTNVQHEVASRPALSGSTVVVATTRGDWVGLSLKNGELLWRTPLGSPIYAPLVADAARVYGVTAEGQVRALWASDGSIAWSLRPPLSLKPTNSGQHTAWPLLIDSTSSSDGYLVVGYRDAGVIALSSERGRLIWKSAPRRMLGIAANPEQIFTATPAGRIEATSLSDGRRLWVQEVGPTSGPPSVALGRVWIPLEARQLVGLALQSGEEQSRLPVGGRVTAALTATRESLWVPTSEGRLYGLRPADGRRIEARIDSPVRTQPVVIDQQIWASSADGRVTALSSQEERSTEPGRSLPIPRQESAAISIRSADEAD